MKVLRFLFYAVLLLQMQFLSAAAPNSNNPQSCSLPAPGWLNATEITSSSITIAWEEVSGSYGYRVERYDVTHGVALPDADVSEPEYISSPHDPGTTIAFTVYPKCDNGDLGESIGGEYTTGFIIVDDIVYFNAPNTPQGDVPVAPNSMGYYLPVGLMDAGKNDPTVQVMRAKLKNTSGANPQFYAEVLLWSHCSTPEFSAAHVMYWNQGSWPQGVTYVENRLNNSPTGPIVSITFKIFEFPFFTLYEPTYVPGENGNPGMAGLKIKNDGSSNIYFSRVTNTEHNPCYTPQMQGGVQITDLVSDGESDDYAAEVSAVQQNAASVSPIGVSPNPFSEGFRVQYSLEEASPVTLILFDHMGRELKSMSLPALPAGHYDTSIHTNNLPTGLYLLALQTNKGRTVTTLVKSN